MQKATVILATVASIFWGSSVLADASCTGPTQDGNTWNLICSADTSGSDERDYQCSYVLSVTNADGVTNEVTAQGSVGNGVTGAIIWSAVQSDGSDITSASVTSGSCLQQ